MGHERFSYGHEKSVPRKTSNDAKKSAVRKPAARASVPKKPAARKKAGSKRELIEPNKGDKRFVRRKADGTLGKTVDVGKSLAADKRRTAKAKVPKGQGDRGDTRLVSREEKSAQMDKVRRW